MAITVRELATSLGCAGLVMALTIGGLLANTGESETLSPPPQAMQRAEPERAPSDRDLLYAEPAVRQASGVSSMMGGTGDGVAAALTLNGELCAEVVAVTKLKRKHRYEVTCATHRDGSGRASYTLNAEDGTVA
jgi:hypothetical protein